MHKLHSNIHNWKCSNLKESMTPRCRSESELHLPAYERSDQFAECRPEPVSRRRGENAFDLLPDDLKAVKMAWEASRGGNRSSAGASWRRFLCVRASRSSASSPLWSLRISRPGIGGRARRSTWRGIGLPSSLCWCHCRASWSSWPFRLGVRVGLPRCFLLPPLMCFLLPPLMKRKTSILEMRTEIIRLTGEDKRL